MNRAEFRRQCLAEIAKLRELRDKSREELLSVIKNLDTSVNDTLRNNIPPPPLSNYLFDNELTCKNFSMSLIKINYINLLKVY